MKNLSNISRIKTMVYINLTVLDIQLLYHIILTNERTNSTFW